MCNHSLYARNASVERKFRARASKGLRLQVFENPMCTMNLLSALNSHAPHDAEERAHRDNTIAFVERHPQSWWRRSTLEGHLTSSAWVLNISRTHALLLHHAKLDRWLQPGGHLDDTDASPADGAMREAREESGLAGLQLASENIFDVDVHAIPARGSEPAHLHYDLRYLIISTGNALALSDESLAARWIALDELARAPFERSISRMAEKSLHR